VVGAERDEGRALLDELFAHLYSDRYRYEHRWAVGDLVLWDNLAVQHARPSVADPEPRILRRVTMGVEPSDRAAYRGDAASRPLPTP
jgi:taurine dioxygenase